MRKQIAIAWLKKKAGYYYKSALQAQNGLSCGTSLGLYISPTSLHYAIKFNKIMDKLQELDPGNCPEFRFKD